MILMKEMDRDKKIIVPPTEINIDKKVLIISDKEIYRSMAMPMGNNEVIDSLVEEIKSEVIAICKPRFGYQIVEGAVTDTNCIAINSTHFKPGKIITKNYADSNHFVLTVASVGEELDIWLEELREQGDIMKIFIADVVASELVEAISTAGILEVEQKFSNLAWKISNAYSPGYCGWNISEQRTFFTLFPDKFCGVTLTDSCLMLPIKSISSMLVIGERVEKQPYSCAICGKRDCYKRAVSM